MMNRRKSPRREHSRANVDWPAVVVSKHATIQGRVNNLSRGGALLYLEGPVEENDSIRVAIEIPEYNDVISTVAKVLRLYSIDTKDEKYTYAVGIQFTDLSSEDLRFFTGNLAPEWEKNYEEPSRQLPLRHVFMRTAGYVLLGIFGLILTVFTFRSFTGNEIDSHQIAAVESRLENIESKLEILSEQTASNGKMKDQLLAIQAELSSLQNEFATMTVVEKLQEQVSSNHMQLADLKIVVSEESEGLAELEPLETVESKTPQKSEIAAVKKKTKSAAPVFHTVKKGENLYRISLKYGVDINNLRKMNKLSDKDSIHPNQKLLIK